MDDGATENPARNPTRRWERTASTHKVDEDPIIVEARMLVSALPGPSRLVMRTLTLHAGRAFQKSELAEIAEVSEAEIERLLRRTEQFSEAFGYISLVHTTADRDQFWIDTTTADLLAAVLGLEKPRQDGSH